MNQEEFFLANAVDGQLTDAQTMQMLNLQEGETLAVATPIMESSVPAADVDAKPAAEVPKVESAPVVLAKDGVHTIPYEKLEEARQGEQHWKKVAAEMQAMLEAAPQAATTPQAAQQGQASPNPDAPAEDLFGDYSEGAIKLGVEKLVASQVGAIRAEMEAKLAAALAPSQHAAAESAAESHFSAINRAHPDVESVVPSKEMADWIAKQPSFSQAGYKAVLEEGSAAEVIELLDNFKAATGRTAATGKPSAAAAAAAAIANAKAVPPTSLSEIPAGSAAHHDQGEAMLEMTDAGLMNMFDGKTPEQINALMNRAI